MNYFENIDWKGIKMDLQEGMEKGMAAMKKGVIVAQKKAGELTEQALRQRGSLSRYMNAKCRSRISRKSASRSPGRKRHNDRAGMAL